MADVGEDSIVMNGFAGKVRMINKDARQLSLDDVPDGRGGIMQFKDLDRPADIFITETFDCGLIGIASL